MCKHANGEEKRFPTIEEALLIAKSYYNAKTYEHAFRVMEFVADNNLIPKKIKEHCIVLAIFHDLVEDTTFDSSGLPQELFFSLKLLTRDKSISYNDYIDIIVTIANDLYHPQNLSGQCAYWVKMADMKDHLSQTETLTEKLKNKYLSAIPHLL